MGRRWGKSTFGAVLLGTFAAMGGRCAWVVPQYRNGYPLWSMLKTAFREHKSVGVVRVNETERRVEVDNAYGGGYIGMYSGDDDADSIRGDAFDLVVLDEAAKLSDRAVFDAIMPTLADLQGKLVAISTPRGRNWFWRLWQTGQDHSQAEIRSFTAPSSANPMPQIQRAYALARQQVSERTFQQEWDAVFVDDTGGVFHGVRACLGGLIQDRPATPRMPYTIGVDLAKMSDYTVCVVMDEMAQQVVAMERFNHESWPLQKARIAELAARWNNARVWIDATGIGDPIYDDLRRAQLRISPYKLTNSTKEQLVENAVLLVEQQKVRWPASLVTLTNELEAYEYEKTPAGIVRMNAPPGMHDDCVIAFALACWPLMTATSFNLTSALQSLGTYGGLVHSGGAKKLKVVI